MHRRYLWSRQVIVTYCVKECRCMRLKYRCGAGARPGGAEAQLHDMTSACILDISSHSTKQANIFSGLFLVSLRPRVQRIFVFLWLATVKTCTMLPPHPTWACAIPKSLAQPYAQHHHFRTSEAPSLVCVLQFRPATSGICTHALQGYLAGDGRSSGPHLL